MHGILARSSPHIVGYDGISPKGSNSRRTVHVNDVAMCAVAAETRACRTLALFWDAEKGKMAASVRLFLHADSVEPEGEKFLTAGGASFLRVWEPLFTDESVTAEIDTADIKDLCEIYSEDEVNECQGELGVWNEGERVHDIQPCACVGVAFVQRRRHKRKSGALVVRQPLLTQFPTSRKAHGR